MKVTVKDKDGQNIELSLDWYDSHDDDRGFDLILGIDTPIECVSVALTQKQVKDFYKAVRFLAKNIPEN